MNRKWKYRLKELFTFSKKERIGFTVLLLLVVAILLYPLLSSTNQESQSFEDFKNQVDSLATDVPPTIPLFDFDPNTADSATFVKLGFSPKQVASILAYRSSGAWFSQPNDFSKLYVVTEEKFQQLEPYIKIEQPVKPFRRVELNTADTTELKRLRGIGSYYAKQIVRYREHLGGLYSAQQLKEIKGIDEERFALFAEQYTLDKSKVRRINVNSADEGLLKKHPYIGSELARKLVAYRKNTTINSFEQLVAADIIDEARAAKLQLYLSFD